MKPRSLSTLLRASLLVPLLALPSCFPEDEEPCAARHDAADAPLRAGPGSPRRWTPAPLDIPEPPAPSFFKVEAMFTFDLPEKTAAQFALPARFKGNLNVDLRAEAVETARAAGPRSRLNGKVDFNVTDPEGIRTYMSNSVTVEGETDGRPSEVMGHGMERAAEAVGMMFGSLPGRADGKGAPAGGGKPGKPPGGAADEPVNVKGDVNVRMDFGR